jgi:hypothetical protein
MTLAALARPSSVACLPSQCFHPCVRRGSRLPGKLPVLTGTNLVGAHTEIPARRGGTQTSSLALRGVSARGGRSCGPRCWPEGRLIPAMWPWVLRLRGCTGLGTHGRVVSGQRERFGNARMGSVRATRTPAPRPRRAGPFIASTAECSCGWARQRPVARRQRASCASTTHCSSPGRSGMPFFEPRAGVTVWYVLAR